MSEAAVAPDYTEPAQGEGDPLLLVGDGTNAREVRHVLLHLQERFDVSLEYEGEHQRAYLVHPEDSGGGADV